MSSLCPKEQKYDALCSTKNNMVTGSTEQIKEYCTVSSGDHAGTWNTQRPSI